MFFLYLPLSIMQSSSPSVGRMAIKIKMFYTRLKSTFLRCWRKEGWPLLTVETEADRDSWSTHERGPFLGWFVGSVQWIFVLPRLLWSPQYKILFSHHKLFHFFWFPRPATWAQWAGSRAGSPVSVLTSVYEAVQIIPSSTVGNGGHNKEIKCFYTI